MSSKEYRQQNLAQVRAQGKKDRRRARLRDKIEACLVALFAELLADLPETVLREIYCQDRSLRIVSSTGERQLSTRRAEIEAYRKQTATRGHAL